MFAQAPRYWPPPPAAKITSQNAKEAPDQVGCFFVSIWLDYLVRLAFLAPLSQYSDTSLPR